MRIIAFVLMCIEELFLPILQSLPKVEQRSPGTPSMFQEDALCSRVRESSPSHSVITPAVNTNLPHKINQSPLLCVCISILAKPRSTVLCKLLYLRKPNSPAPVAAEAWLGRPCAPFLPRAAPGVTV